VAFVISQARPPAAFCTLFAILSSSSVSELDSVTDEDLVSKMYQAPSWGSGKVLEGTARKAKKRSFESRLSDVGEEMVFKSAESDLSPETVEETFKASVPELRTSMPDDVNSLSFVISEWPKVVESVFILRAQVRLARELQGDASVGFSELIVGLDDKLAFLKGYVGSPPMPGASMFDHGLDLFTAAEGVAGWFLHCVGVGQRFPAFLLELGGGFRKIWSRACACGSEKAWCRGLGDNASLTTVFFRLCWTRSTSCEVVDTWLAARLSH